MRGRALEAAVALAALVASAQALAAPDAGALQRGEQVYARCWLEANPSNNSHRVTIR